MKQVRQRYTDAKVADLIPHPSNPRQGDVGAIHSSIASNGFYGALIVQASTGYVIAGNHRLQAVRASGADTVPVIEVDVTDDEATRIMLADNRTQDLATYDDAALISLLQSVGLEGTGYDSDDVDEILARFTDDLSLDGTPSGGHRVRKSLIVEMHPAHLAWTLDALGEYRAAHHLGSNGDAILHLLGAATGKPTP